MWCRRPDLDDLDEDIRQFIAAETEDNMGRGMGADEARAAALRRFGNVARVKEDVRAVWVPGWLDRLRQDGRDALRSVRRSPALSAAIVVTLALGIGLTTAIYSVVQAVLLRPLAYAHPDRMLWLSTRAADSSRDIMNSIDFAAWQSQAASLEHMVAYEAGDATVAAGGEASRWRIVSASHGFWELTGARPALGRLPADSASGALAITHRAFVDLFRGDPGVIGRTVTVDGRPATIAAVLAEGFQPQLPTFGIIVDLDAADPAAYRLMRVEPPPAAITASTGVRVLQAIGAVKEGVTIDEARAELEAIHARYQREHPTPFGTTAAVVVPLQDKIVGPSRKPLGVLLAAALVVLLIACTNAANLLLSRAGARRREMAVRMAVGGGQRRLVRLLLAESLACALLGGLAGLLLAVWLVNVVIATVGGGVPRLAETQVGFGVLAVAAAISVGTALVFGIGPALALAATNLQQALTEGGRTVPASRRLRLTGRAMVASQVALTIVLLAGAGLMLKSVWRMTRYPAGFAPDQVLTARLDIRGPQYRDQRARQVLTERLMEKARNIPGVGDVAITTGRGSMMLVVHEGEGMPPPGERERRSAPVSSVSPGFGRLLGMTLVRGRWFAERDLPGAVIINESLARRDFPQTDPIGRRIRLPWLGQNGLGTIIGVVRDLKYAAIDADPVPELFFHCADTPFFSMTLVVRTAGDPHDVAPAIRSVLASIDPTQAFYNVKTLSDVLSESIAPRRFNLLLLAIFAIVALALAALGVYGVVACAVSERTHEIGIRMALGARRAQVVGVMVAQGLWSVVTGLVVGLFGAWAATRVIAGLLYDVEPHDPATFATTTLALAAVATLACVVPALRAAAVDPVTALRTG